MATTPSKPKRPNAPRPSAPAPAVPAPAAEAPANDYDDLLSKVSGALPALADSPQPEAEKAALKQADKAAEDIKAPKAAKVRPASKTHSVLPKVAYAGPRDGRTFMAGASGAISRRDTLHRRYLNLIARPEGLDENTGRRVNINRGPTCGGFANYAADKTGVPIIFVDSAYRVAEHDVSGKIVRASETRREEVYELTGGEEFTKLVVAALGPDFTKFVPAPEAKADKAA